MHRTRKSALLTMILGLAAASLLGGCNAGNSISDKKIEYIDLNRAVTLYEQQQRENHKALFLDVRKPERFAEGHIPGARNYRANDVALQYGTDPSLEKYDNLIIYGENAGSAGSRAMAKRLIEAGYNSMLKKRIKLFLGGWVEWDETGLDIETSDLPDTESP
jgi:rhodanese-related sulfurtransferase